jgi:hypothetical protein
MNSDALAHNIRGWVHYDNMMAALNKQVANARKQRDAFEEQVKIMLSQHKMSSSVIQISGGQLQFQEEKTTSGLTMKSLGESSELFFKGHPEIKDPKKMSTELTNYIKEHRTHTTHMRLKKLKGAPEQ